MDPDINPQQNSMWAREWRAKLAKKVEEQYRLALSDNFTVSCLVLQSLNKDCEILDKIQALKGEDDGIENGAYEDDECPVEKKIVLFKNLICDRLCYESMASSSNRYNVLLGPSHFLESPRISSLWSSNSQKVIKMLPAVIPEDLGALYRCMSWQHHSPVAKTSCGRLHPISHQPNIINASYGSDCLKSNPLATQESRIWGVRGSGRLYTSKLLACTATLALVGAAAAMDPVDTTALSAPATSPATVVTIRTTVVGLFIAVTVLLHPLRERAKRVLSLLSNGYVRSSNAVRDLLQSMGDALMSARQIATSLSAPVMAGSSLVFFVLRNDRDLMPLVAWIAFGIWVIATMIYTWIQVDRIQRRRRYWYALACAVLIGISMGVVALIIKQAPLQGGIVTAAPACVAFAVFAPTPFLAGSRTSHVSPV